MDEGYIKRGVVDDADWRTVTFWLDKNEGGTEDTTWEYVFLFR